ncbi:MAG: hypothetical protein IJW13_01910 [Clostridia bacterium]|nr:hypothetical protein [Clostridia bacterium]
MSYSNSYEFSVDTSMADKFGRLSPTGFQRLIISATEKELIRMQVDIPTLIKNYGVSWILLSLTVKVFAKIGVGENLTVKTHHTWRKSVLYRRDFAFYNSQNQLVAVGATFSSLFNLETRRICTNRDVYEKLTFPEDEELFEATHKPSKQGEFVQTECVAVRKSWIDSLGHVNNFRYGELTYDSIPTELEGMPFNRLEIYFTGELSYGEKVVLKRNLTDCILQVEGLHEDGKQAFLSKLFY